jgi:hypothetical protein
MKLKQLIILFVIVVILGGLVMLKKYREPKELEIAEYVELKFQPGEDEDLDQVSRVTVYKGEENKEDPVILVKTEKKRWQVESFYNVGADKDKVKSLIGTLSALEGELRSSSAKTFKDFAISDEKGIHVELEDSDGEKRAVVIGLESIGYRGNFIRKAGSSETYFVDRNLLSKVGIWGNAKEAELEEKFFFDLTFLEFDEDEISSFSIARYEDNNPIYASRIMRSIEEETEKRRWAFVRDDLPFDIDASKIKTFLKDIQKKRATEVVAFEEDFDYGFDKPVWELFAEREDREPLKFIGGKFKDDDSNQLYMREKDASVVYLVSDYIFKEINKDDGNFFINNPLRIADNEVEEIITQRDKQKKRYFKKEEIVKKEVPVAEIEEGEVVEEVVEEVKEEEIVTKWVLEGEEEVEKEEAARNLINELRKLNVEGLMLDRAKVSKKSKEWISVKSKDKEEVIVDVYEPLETKMYPAKLRGSEVIFTISEQTYQNIFEK